MADRSGIGAQLGVAAEVTYGTFVAPTRFLPFLDESLELSIERMESEGLRSLQRVQRSDSWAPGSRQAGGSISFDVGNKGFALLLEHMLGTIATTVDGTGKKHSATIGDLFGKMLSVQVGRPDVLGTVQPFSYTGVKVDGWELSQEVDDFLKLSLDVDVRDEATATGLTAATAPALTELYHWGELAITVGGSAFEADSFTIGAANGLKTDRFKLKGSTLKDQPIEAEKREITGTLVGEFSALTEYGRFVAGTTAQLIATWTKVTTYDTAKPYKIVLTAPVVRYDGGTPGVSDAGVLTTEFPFKVLDSGSGSPLTIDYYTADATP